MPIIISAKKKLRQDKKKTAINLLSKKAVKEAIKKFKSHPSSKLLNEVFSLLDRMVKKKIFHANKAARLKSNLSKLIQNKKTANQKPSKSKSSKRNSPPSKNP